MVFDILSNPMEHFDASFNYIVVFWRLAEYAHFSTLLLPISIARLRKQNF